MAKKTPRERDASKTLHVGLVLDMSGSMSGVHLATVEGVNDYIRGLQEESTPENPTFLNIMAFDTVFERWVVNQSVEEVAPITSSQYVPRGLTALYDAIANTVRDIDGELGEDEKALIVVWTDGLENSSIEFGLLHDGARRIAAFVGMYEAKGNWTFVWMSAGHVDLASTQHYAASAGFAPGNTATYTSDAASVHRTSEALVGVTSTRKRAATGQSMSAFDDAGVEQDQRTYDDAPAPDPGEETQATKKTIDDLFGGKKQ